MNLNVDSWKEFRLGDLFSEMYKAEAHVKGELECYDVPLDNTIRFVSRTEMNNGCDCYVLNNGLSGIEKANAIVLRSHSRRDCRSRRSSHQRPTHRIEMRPP